MTQDDRRQLSQKDPKNQKTPSANVASNNQTGGGINCECNTCCQCCKQLQKANPTNWDWWFDSPINVFTCLLVIVGALQAFFLWLAFCESRRASKAAQSSADTAKQTLILTQRAMVSVPNFKWQWHPDTSKPGRFWYSFRPLWSNSGSTQTRDMKTNVVHSLRDTQLPDGFSFPLPPHNYPAILEPHGVIEGAIGTLRDDQLQEVQNGTKFYYIWGTATYVDIFGFHHTTKFCRQIMNVLGNIQRPNSEVVEMRFDIVFPEHNTAD